MVASVDMTGTVASGMPVIGRAGSLGGKAAWTCRCACGAEFVAVGVSLRQGIVKSCPPCAKTKLVAKATTHGGSRTPEYVCYFAMKARCYYPKDKRYPRYGGRGIRVCDRWLESFAHFMADMGPMPATGMSIERVDRDGHYEPGNCKWADRFEQANNRSNNTLIEIDGRLQTLTAWARETGVHRTVITRRIQRGLTGAALIQKGNTK